MGTTIDLATVVKNGTPREEGTRLADSLLSQDNVQWDELTLKARWLPLELFNASFFFGFLQRIVDERPDLLTRARSARWSLPYAAVEAAIPALMSAFRPRSATPTNHGPLRGPA